MAIVLLFFVVIHFTLGEIPQLQPFTEFLEHAHRITDASELGLQGQATRDEGLYSPHEERDDGAVESHAQVPRFRNATQFRDLPHEIYRSTDDDEAYFITFRELCSNKLSAEDERMEGTVEKATAASRKTLPKRTHLGAEANFYEFDGEDAHNNPIYRTPEINGYHKADNLVEPAAGFKILGGPSKYRGDTKLSVDDDRELLELNGPIEQFNIKSNTENSLNQGDIDDETANRLIHASRVFRTQHIADDTKQNTAQNIDNSLHNSDRQNVIEPDGDVNNELHVAKSMPNVKLILNDRPKTLDVKIDMNSMAIDRSPAKIQHNGEASGELDGISLDGSDAETVNADEAKSFLKEKISSQIQKKEDEIIGRLEAKASGFQNAALLANVNSMTNLSMSSKRNPRAVDMIDRTITYTEHERTMKQEVEVTYKRAQDIAKAILKTSEAIANSLDLCRKPISTNFISDEPLTEAENIIDQIVGQLKESLELTMGCRTCVKPHKDLMLFLRWLIFDDVSVKLCPSKPKAADLRKNYLLFNHDNMFPGRVCQPNEFPKAPLNCSATGEVNVLQDGENGKADEGKPSAARKKSMVSKRRHKPGDNKVDVGGGNIQKTGVK